MFQSDRLAMVGIGSDGSEADFAPGIHLRWSFTPDLGFPKDGFTVYRRPARSPQFEQFHVDRLPTSSRASFMLRSGIATLTCKLRLKKLAARGGAPAALLTTGKTVITLTFAERLRAFSVTEAHANGTLTMRAYDGEALVAIAKAGRRNIAQITTVSADRFDRVVLDCPAGTTLNQLQWATLPQHERPATGWGTPLLALALPKNKAEALARIEAFPPPSGRDYERACKQLFELFRLPPEGRAVQARGTGTQKPPSLTVHPVKLLLLMAAADIWVARMLGLYVIDKVDDQAYDYLVVASWGPTRQHSWICYGQQIASLPEVPVPTGLLVSAKAWTSPAGGASATATQSGCALTWNVNTANDLPVIRRPILYHVYRQENNNGAWSEASKLTHLRPVLVTVQNGRRPASFYLDGPLADGEYRYAVAGVDVFGRESVRSEPPEGITLLDRIAPPPPADVKAWRDDRTGEVSVTWSWNPPQRTMAPDAAAFRLFWQTERLAPLEGVLTDVRDDGDTSDCVTEFDLAADYAGYTDGWLINRGRQFCITGIRREANAIVVTVRNIRRPDQPKDTPKPAVPDATFRNFLSTPQPWKLAGRCLLQLNWSDARKWSDAQVSVPVAAGETYRASLPAVPITATREQPVAYALIGVATIDRSGNLGAIGTPVRINARLTEVPAAPPTPLGPSYAGYPDYFGKAEVRLEIVGAEPGLNYEILRASDAAVAALQNPPVAGSSLSDAGLLAKAQNADAVFSVAGTKQPDGSLLTDTDGDGRIACFDTVPGRSRTRYLYRIIACDKAGNRSVPSAPLLVKLHDVMPPRVPTIAKVQGGENQITLSWASNPNERLAGYEVYRAEDQEAAADWRTMLLVKAQEADVYSVTVSDPPPPQLQFTDREAIPSKPYFYGVVAVKVNDEGRVIRSALSRVVTAQAYDLRLPDPPTLVQDKCGWVYTDDEGNIHEWSEDALPRPPNLVPAVRLLWTSDDRGSSFLVQRKWGGGGGWESLSGWIQPSEGDEDGSFSVIDKDAVYEQSYQYGIKSKSRAGLLSSESIYFVTQVLG